MDLIIPGSAMPEEFVLYVRFGIDLLFRDVRIMANRVVSEVSGLSEPEILMVKIMEADRWRMVRVPDENLRAELVYALVVCMVFARPQHSHAHSHMKVLHDLCAKAILEQDGEDQVGEMLVEFAKIGVNQRAGIPYTGKDLRHVLWALVRTRIEIEQSAAKAEPGADPSVHTLDSVWTDE
ncbi:MAG: hypothetical protein A3J48_03465 [Candidatus Doudnabacteria bacterium RIFCSPHIGHO2_02_FULL_46_11]|uniref:Uncharacterized protein n=1 Tax=Candidatus Doudnabacteria bacterium RIFCSPHIGHO2_02_FULL_46_11 TaxID=1817832 RepID=A0A1F5P4Y1_9BACT|nr:MAG: hypothetical protein A3J48_03465 [Candidatus Doudnabacteria bacterium RIFCSPHIGHO2_02_FULL_46_11]